MKFNDLLAKSQDTTEFFVETKSGIEMIITPQKSPQWLGDKMVSTINPEFYDGRPVIKVFLI